MLLIIFQKKKKKKKTEIKPTLAWRGGRWGIHISRAAILEEIHIPLVMYGDTHITVTSETPFPAFSATHFSVN